jgi:ectoine hydroxylase-related dioxygenase (phytanoyl-CoA dioxygenase family)
MNREIDCKKDPGWLVKALETMQMLGFVAVSGVLDTAMLGRIREAMYRAQKAIVADVGTERLQRAGELGVLRLVAKYDPIFLELLATPEILAVVDATVSPTSCTFRTASSFPRSSQGKRPRFSRTDTTWTFHASSTGT